MSGYPQGSGYPYVAPPANPYGSAPPPPYGAAPQQPYGAAPSPPYGHGGPQPSAPYSKPEKPGKTHGGGGGGGYENPPPAAGYGAANPFGALLPSQFPPGTDPSLVACFQIADQDGSGLIDDRELQRALSSYNQGFSLRTVHLLMYLFTSSNVRKIGEISSLPFFFFHPKRWLIFVRVSNCSARKLEGRNPLAGFGFRPLATIIVAFGK